MKSPLFAILLMTFTCLHSVFAYDAIWNIDGWDKDLLKKSGITVTTWKHDQIGEDPAFDWVRISYDTSILGKDQNVLMTLRLIGENGQTISASRAEHKKDEPKTLILLFAIEKKDRENSYVDIMVPELLAEGGKREFGNPGFGGYSLHMNRILELAGKPEIDKPSDSDRK